MLPAVFVEFVATSAAIIAEFAPVRTNVQVNFLVANEMTFLDETFAARRACVASKVEVASLMTGQSTSFGGFVVAIFKLTFEDFTCEDKNL